MPAEVGDGLGVLGRDTEDGTHHFDPLVAGVFKLPSELGELPHGR